MIASKVLLGAAMFAIPLTAQPALASDGLDFLDNRPVVIPLDDVDVGQRFAVQVLDIPAGDRDVTLHVVFEPAGVITVDPSVGPTDGGIVEFVIELEHLVEGSGELVAVADGAVARRQISTQFRQTGASSLVGSLQFAGVRIAPFTGLVRIPPLEFPTNPETAAPAGSTPPPVRIGLITSEHGDVAEVVREGSEFAVYGIRTVGEFSGTVDLVPEQDGGDADVIVRVRDIAAWPLVALLAGLAVAHLLDRYQRRQRPQKLHERRLATLRDQVRAASRQTGGRLRITGAGTSSDSTAGGLLLDQLIEEARAAFHPHMSDAERSAWEPGGVEYERLAGIVTRFRRLCQSVRGLDELKDQVIGWIEADDRLRAGQALDRSLVGAALRDTAIRSLVDLDQTERPLPDARRYLDDFAWIYRTAVAFRRHADPAARVRAEQVLTELFRAPHDLASVEEAADDLEDRWRQRLSKAPLGSPLPPTSPYEDRWAGPPSAPAGPPAAGSHQPEPPSEPSSRRGILAALGAAALLAVTAVALTLLDAAEGDIDAHPGPATTEPQPTTPPVTPAPTIPHAPVADLTDTSVAPVLQVTTFTSGQLAWFGVVAPLLIAAAVAALAWLVVRWRRARSGRRTDPLTAEAIDQQVRREDLRFSLIAGILVALSGMSLLYVGNPTFGTVGDYLTLALWGAAVGEGLQLGRRLWPSIARL